MLHSLLQDDNIEVVELLELREKKGGRGINLGKIAGAEARAVQRWREAERGRRQRATSSSFKAELLELIKGWDKNHSSNLGWTLELVLNMRRSRRLAGLGCDERILETAAMRL